MQPLKCSDLIFDQKIFYKNEDWPSRCLARTHCPFLSEKTTNPEWSVVASSVKKLVSTCGLMPNSFSGVGS